MSDRRDFLKSFAAAALTPVLVGAADAEAAKPEAHRHKVTRGDERPKNVVLMICDDLGYGDLGCYGSKIPTPNLDKLAAGGIRFTHMNSAHPICSASRAALLTGRYAERSHTMGAYYPSASAPPLPADRMLPSMEQFMAQAHKGAGGTATGGNSIHNLNMGMSLEETTLANLFHDRGYRTEAIGKWHLGDTPEYLPTARGFDSYLGVPYSDDMEPLPLIRDTQIIEPETDRDQLTPRYTEEALRFLKAGAGKPFFLYLAYSYPHDPARASARFRGKTGFGNYGDAIAEIDWSAGEVIHTLQSIGELDNTLVLFTSDHGPWYQGSPGPLRGRKGTTFEGGHRIPLIAHWPAGIAAGKVSAAWASNLDVVPTLTALCKLGASPKPLDGVDISQVLLGHEDKVERKPILYFASSTSKDGSGLHCARKDQWKLRIAQAGLGEIYISDYTSGRTDFLLSRPELYNLDNDPGESYDVAHEHPDVASEIMAGIEAQMQTMPDNVQCAYQRLKRNVAQPSTPPGAAPRPHSDVPMPAMIWIPPDRR